MQRENEADMRIVFMGTPSLAACVLEKLLQDGRNVTLAVTQPDRPKGRGRGVQMTPVKETALRWGVEVFAPEKIKTPEAVERLRREAPDLIVVAAYGQILSGEILGIPRLGCVNVHASLLPAYRGAAPVQWAVINGERRSGVTIMQMDEGLDTGDMISVRETALSPDETGDSLYEKLSVLGAELLSDTLPSIEDGTAVRTPQKEEDSCYAPMLRRENGNLDWTRPAAELERMVRGLCSWPGSYSFFRGKMLKIWKSTVLEERGEDPKAAPGTVLRAEKGVIAVQCGEGVLGLTEIQAEGKKRMPVQAFLLGTAVQKGEILSRERG